MTAARAALVPVLLALLFGSAVPAASADRAARIDELIAAYHDLDAFNGMVLVADGEGIILEKGYGDAEVEWGIPNAPDVRYRVGSITKQFTAAAVMRLVDEGRLSLDATLSSVLPWYRADTGSLVTIEELLNHTSGIDRAGVARMIDAEGYRPMPLRDEVLEFCSGDLEWEPGTRFAYNNAGYLILGAVIEEITGATYAEALGDLILDPAGLTDTGVDRSDLVLPRRAGGYDRTPDGLRRAVFVEPALAASAGGVYSTAGDLYLWDRALYTDAVLSEDARARMFTPGRGGYGFGWWILQVPFGPEGAVRTLIRHPGEGDGFNSIFWRVPEDRFCVILINNFGRADLPAIGEGVVDILYGRDAKISITAVMRQALDRGDVADAIGLYRDLKENQSDRYSFGEDEMNRFGYALLRRGRSEAALEVLALNTEAYPGSANAFDSLAEAHAAVGDTTRAIELYRRALEIDPEFENAAVQIEKLTGTAP